MANAGGKVAVQDFFVPDELRGKYIKSLFVDGSHIYCPAGAEKLVELSFDGSAIQFSCCISLLGFDYGDLNHLAKIGKFWYLSFWNRAFIRCSSLEALEKGEYENLYESFGFKGTPYYMSVIGERFYITEICGRQSVISFSIGKENDGIKDIRCELMFTELPEASFARKRVDTLL